MIGLNSRSGRSLQSLEAPFQNIGKEIDEKSCSSPVRILGGIVCRNFQGRQMLLLHEYQQRLANFYEAQSARAGEVGGLKIGDYIHVEVKNKLMRAAVNSVHCRL